MAHGTYDERVDFYWAPAIATLSAPTVTEMGAATKLTCEISDFPNLEEKAGTVERPTLCSRFTAKDPGRITVDDTTISFYYDDTVSSDSQDIRALLARDAEGFLLRCDSVGGTLPVLATAGTVVDVWPVTITSNSKNQPAFGEQRKFTVGVTATDPPELDATVVS